MKDEVRFENPSERVAVPIDVRTRDIIDLFKPTLRHEVGQIVVGANHEVSGCSNWDGRIAATADIA